MYIYIFVLVYNTINHMLWTHTIVKKTSPYQDFRSTVTVGVLGGTPCLEVVRYTVVNQFHQIALFLTDQSKGYYAIRRLASFGRF